MKKALLVIDVQNIYTCDDYDYYVKDSKKIVENINFLIKEFEKDDSLIIYIKHIHKKDGSDAGRMFDYLEPSDDIEFIEGTHAVEYSKDLYISKDALHILKNRYDSFIGTSLQDILIKKGIEKVVIVGFMANFCCASTARTAHDLDYFVDFIRDATGTPGTEDFSPEDIIKVTCSTLVSGFANVIATEEEVNAMSRSNN